MAFLQSLAEGVWRQGGHSNIDDLVMLEMMTDEIDLPRGTRAAISPGRK
ncbi:hypothetical protein X759_03300 [Mesorhizobium sp. LSHC420B00]|nr:hypothetical protein X759_03300 [Mesorhizobium sp. LSHC420B00]